MTNNIYFSILWDLEISGRPDWESTQLTLFGKGPLNGPYKVWLMPCEPTTTQFVNEHSTIQSKWPLSVRLQTKWLWVRISLLFFSPLIAVVTTNLLNHLHLITQPLLSYVKQHFFLPKNMQSLSMSSHTWLTFVVACHYANIIFCRLLVLDSSLITTGPACPNHGSAAAIETFNIHSSLIHVVIRYICIGHFTHIELSEFYVALLPVFLSRHHLQKGCQPRLKSPSCP